MLVEAFQKLQEERLRANLALLMIYGFANVFISIIILYKMAGIIYMIVIVSVWVAFIYHAAAYINWILETLNM